MRNVTEDDLTRLFDRMVDSLSADGELLKLEDAAQIYRALAQQLLELGWDETCLTGGALHRTIGRYAHRPDVVLGLRLACPEPVMLDSAGAASWLVYNSRLNGWVLNLVGEGEQFALPNRQGWNYLLEAWAKWVGTDQAWRVCTELSIG